MGRGRRRNRKVVNGDSLGEKSFVGHVGVK